MIKYPLKVMAKCISNINFLQYGRLNISLGKNSDFEGLYKNDYSLVLLGCKASEGATYLHHLEAIKNVP